MDRRDTTVGNASATGTLTRGLARFVPSSLARRAVSVDVTTDRAVYDRGDPVAVTVTFENRLPVPVDVPTPAARRWGWTVNGNLEASDERRYTRSQPSTFAFRAGERKQVSFVWHGRLERTDDHESVLPDPGEYEIRAFVATHEGTHRPSDAATIQIR
ncbi:hypothetical protein [Natrialbaceae archaeon AArc-T1-2]|uniref:hypothetical protein n=1 Tax=Natrialbaceae archaeon AArc-T1-2 TaxID=3053904 RepID=UPI00255A7329|nr:hypothetical protein [Natrialbaceae archaeon AArc-T1-2]WIV65663.1 hypothetical protein QQ977_08075 [Natrialbaceae archaeon AArc-T1-2]